MVLCKQLVMITFRLNFRRIMFLLFLGLFSLAAATLPLHSFGQGTTESPVILLTWQAGSYVPTNYQGKALAGPSSIISASVEIIDQGKVADLSRSPIRWYLDGSLVGSGVGKKTVNVRAPSLPLQGTQLMVQIPGYKGELLFKTVVIFVSSPIAAIEAPYVGGDFGSRSVSVRGVPYFFNVSDMSTLIFNWTVNGQSAPTATSTEEKTQLVVNINPDAAIGSTLDIGLVIRDPKLELFYASKNVTLNLSR